MKKNYQVPETVICETEISIRILEDSGEIGAGGNLTNETNTFDESEMPSDIPSSIWDD